MSATPTIETVERRTKPGLVPSLINPSWTAGQTESVEGWFASVRLGTATMEFSRLDGETEWTADACWDERRGPVFAHGFGSRCTIPRIADTYLAADLDEAVAEVSA